MLVRALAATALLGCAVLPAVARQEAPAPVALRIVVTDAQGRGVAGLKAADIEITEAGRVQPIGSVAFHKAKGGRKIALLLDDYHVTAGINSARARAALLEFMHREWGSDDVFFVMKPLDQASKIAPVAAGDVRTAIAQFEGRKGDYAPRTPYEAELMSVAPPTAPRQRGQVARAAMQALVTQLAAYDDKDKAAKAVIVISEGFPSDDRVGRERMTTLRTVARSAHLSGVSVYVIDPSAEAQTPSPFNEPWQMLVAQTGGTLTSGGSSPEQALARIAADLDEHYIVTLPPAREDGAFHPVDVKVKRRDVTVRAPSGFWTPIAAERILAPLRPPASTYLRTPHLTGLIQPWFRMGRAGTGRTQVTFSWAPRGSAPKDASVEFAAVTFEGVPLFPARNVPSGSGEASRATFEAAPGAIQVTMAIRDRAGKVLDTEVRYIDVPALDARGPMIAAIELLRTRSVREFERVQLEADAMPADTRNFDRQDRVIVRVRAFGAAGTTPGITARLLNPRGQTIVDLRALPDVAGQAQFDLPLARYASGDYRIEIRAADDKTATRQLISFRLVG